MSSKQKSNNTKSKEDDEIWNSLFGSHTDDKSATQKREGYTTLMSSKDKKQHRSKQRKKTKTESRSSSRHHSSSSRSHSHPDSHRRHHSSNGNRNNSNNSNNTNYSREGPTTAERLSQFLCTPKTRARLPPPPLECKFLSYPHKADRFTKFCGTNLELNYKWEMHHDSLFPLPLDLMDPDYYNPLKQQYEYDDNEQIFCNKEDERILQLLEEREYEKNVKEEQLMPEQEAFLLQTQYLTGGIEYELTESQRKGYDDDLDHNNTSGNGKKRKFREWENGLNDLSDAIINNKHSLDNVEQTFNDIQEIKRHPTRNVQVLEMFDVFPHEGLLEKNYTHVQFDKDPIYHTRKCQFINTENQQKRMRIAKLATENTLLRCVNRKGLENNIDDIDDDIHDIDNRNKGNKNEYDWFSLYATNGNRKKSEYDDEDIIKYEWAAEFVPVQMNKKKKMFFMVIPKGNINENDDEQRDDVYYANFNNRLGLRHKQTDTSQDNNNSGGKKGLSVQDRKFFKQQPMNIKLNVPRINQSSQEY